MLQPQKILEEMNFLGAHSVGIQAWIWDGNAIDHVSCDLCQEWDRDSAVFS